MRPAVVFLMLSLFAPTANAQHQILRDQLARTTLARVIRDGVTRLVPDPMLTEDEVVRSRTDSSIALPLAGISRIDRRASSVGRAAAIGAAIGGGAGLLFTAALASDEMFDMDATSAVGGALVFALAGAGVGALIGSGSDRWQTVYRAPLEVRPMVAAGDRTWLVGLRIRR